MLWKTEVIRHELVGMSQDSAYDCGLGQTGQELFFREIVEMKHENSASVFK